MSKLAGKNFPSGKYRVGSTEADANGLQAWTQILPRERIEPFDEFNDTARGAYYAVKAAPGFAGAASKPLGVQVNRISVWVPNLYPNGEAAPSTFTFMLRAACGCVGERVVEGTWTGFDAWNSAGLVVQYAGLLCTGFELWWRLEPDATPYEALLEVSYDRVGPSAPAVVAGAQTIITYPP